MMDKFWKFTAAQKRFVILNLLVIVFEVSTLLLIALFPLIFPAPSAPTRQRYEYRLSSPPAPLGGFRSTPELLFSLTLLAQAVIYVQNVLLEVGSLELSRYYFSRVLANANGQYLYFAIVMYFSAFSALQAALVAPIVLIPALAHFCDVLKVLTPSERLVGARSALARYGFLVPYAEMLLLPWMASRMYTVGVFSGIVMLVAFYQFLMVRYFFDMEMRRCVQRANGLWEERVLKPYAPFVLSYWLQLKQKLASQLPQVQTKVD